jgi:excisionase family DNA binding protein
MASVVHVPANSRSTRDAAVLRRAAKQIANPALADLIITLAANLSTGVTLAANNETVSPARAAEMLGVTRQYVDKLISNGRLPASRKPGSRHKLIAVSDLVKFEKNRRTATQRVAVLVNDLIDAGVEY